MYYSGTHKKQYTIQEGREQPVSLPPNRRDDHCQTGASQPFCGYWFNSGWSTNDNGMGDPEDWAPTHWSRSKSGTVYLMCMETAPWTDTTTDPGHSWRVAAVPFTQAQANTGIAGMRSVCSAAGFDHVGRGVERANSWLVAKRYLWKSGLGDKMNWPDASPAVVMPMYYSGTHKKQYTIQEGR